MRDGGALPRSGWAADAGLPSPSGEGGASLYDPLVVRAVFAASAILLGAVVRYGLSLPLDLAFFVLIAAWFAVSAGYFRWVGPEAASPFYLPVRIGLFALDVLVAVWAAHFVAASAWLAVLFVLFPALEWNLLHPGRVGLAGSLGAVFAAGAVVAGESLGFVPAGSVFRGVDPLYQEPVYALAAFLVAALVILGLSAVVGRYAEASRQKSRELEALNRRIQGMAEDVRRAHGELSEAYEEVRSAQAELVSAAKMATLGNLIRGVAHEINTPLGALSSNHDVTRRALERLQGILADEVVDESELGEVRRIVRAVDGVQATNAMAVERMKAIVSSLRTFGRPDRSEIDRVDLNESLESCVSLVSHETKQRVEVVRDYGELEPVECFPNQINQVFMNLLVNASQAISGKGTITLRTRSEGDGVVVVVEDTGSGIPAENLDRIFEPGFTTKGSRVGMGLGLIIARQIVERHGGRITVESEPGKGTAFTLRLPLRLPARALEGAEDAGGGAGVDWTDGEPVVERGSTT